MSTKHYFFPWSSPSYSVTHSLAVEVFKWESWMFPFLKSLSIHFFPRVRVSECKHIKVRQVPQQGPHAVSYLRPQSAWITGNCLAFTRKSRDRSPIAVLRACQDCLGVFFPSSASFRWVYAGEKAIIRFIQGLHPARQVRQKVRKHKVWSIAKELLRWWTRESKVGKQIKRTH